jgi:tetratricopeptide (TPR) repeat protein
MTMKSTRRASPTAALILITAAFLHTQIPSDPAELVREGQKLVARGNLDEAIEAYRRAIEVAPDLFEAHFGIGVALDLKGDYTEARTHFTRAVALAEDETVELPPDGERENAIEALAISWVFESNAEEAARFLQQLFDERTSRGDFESAAESAAKLGQIYLESGDVETAFTWYQTAYETARRHPGLSAEDRRLVEMGWQYALGTINARRGRHDQAKEQVAALEALLKQANDAAVRLDRLLAGYVAFHAGDDDTAVKQLSRVSPADPLALLLLAGTHERRQESVKALALYREIMGVHVHDISVALARPLARKKLGAGAAG